MRAYKVSDDKHAERHLPGGADPLSITAFGGAPLDAYWKPNTQLTRGQLVVSPDNVGYAATADFATGTEFSEDNLARVGTTGSTVVTVQGQPPDGNGNVQLSFGTAADYDVGVNEGNLILLTVGGKIPTSAIPALAINDIFTAASQADMLALAAQRGDMALRTDLDPNEIYILKADDPSVLANWILLSIPGSVQSVNGQQGTVVLGAADVGAVPTGRKVNGYALTGDVTLTAADVGALPTSTTATDIGALPDSLLVITSPDGSITYMIVLGASDAIPAGTPTGTIVLRTES